MSAPATNVVALAVGALLFSLEHFANIDRANAAMHCSGVRYSPITFAVADAAEALGARRHEHADLAAVLADRGRYELDGGR